MQLDKFPFSINDWASVDAVIYNGIAGRSTWKTIMMNDTRIRLVEYSKNYVADHWCDKGHIIYCIDGDMETELKDGRKFTLEKGMVYMVGDNSDGHRTSTINGCTLFIVD